MKAGYDISLSERLEELLGDETFGEVLQQVEKELREEIFSYPDSSQRDQIYHEMHALTRLKLRLQTLVDELKMRRNLNGS